MTIMLRPSMPAALEALDKKSSAIATPCPDMRHREASIPSRGRRLERPTLEIDVLCRPLGQTPSATFGPRSPCCVAPFRLVALRAG